MCLVSTHYACCDTEPKFSYQNNHQRHLGWRFGSRHNVADSTFLIAARSLIVLVQGSTALLQLCSWSARLWVRNNHCSRFAGPGSASPPTSPYMDSGEPLLVPVGTIGDLGGPGGDPRSGIGFVAQFVRKWVCGSLRGWILSGDQ